MAYFGSSMGHPGRPGYHAPRQPQQPYQRHPNHPSVDLPTRGVEGEHMAIMAKLNAIGAILSSTSRGIGDGLERKTISNAVELIGKLQPGIEELNSKLNLLQTDVEVLKTQWQPLDNWQQEIAAIRGNLRDLTQQNLGIQERSTNAGAATNSDRKMPGALKRRFAETHGASDNPPRRSTRARPAKKMAAVVENSAVAPRVSSRKRRR